ncbi:exocyst complex component EXO70A3-like [Miscanthus floridulus]|uniref:exocyst complex component EXO70A3-like n=1 Tax=Miscanthus floridulus TaxID=154761 RepID=UPI00345A2981
MAAVRRRAWSGGYRQWVSGNTGAPSGTTISSTTDTPSSYSVGERPLAVEEESAEGLDQERAMELPQELAETLRLHIRGLVEEFSACADGNFSAPDRWLSELQVAWLFRLADLDASGRRIFISRQLQHLVQSWNSALRAITTSIVRACFSGFSSQDQEEATVAPPEAPEFVRFVETTLLKMLTFVDAIAAPLNVDDPSCQQHTVSTNKEGAAEKLRTLLDVHDALSRASTQIVMSFSSSPYVGSTRITDDMEGLLSAELGKLDEAVSDTVDHIRTAVMSSLGDDSSWGTAHTLLPSPNIHKVTRSVVNYVKALHPANYAHHHREGDMIFLTSLIMEMVASLEQKLTKVSQTFSDQSIRFLFLINNTNFIGQQLHQDPTHKIDNYIESYLQVSWAPVLKCLNNPTFHCGFTRSSPIPKFQSKFQTIYTAQKLWKVPDPELRKRLREAIIGIVVSGFMEYLEDNNRITPGVPPQELQELLEELFEG